MTTTIYVTSTELFSGKSALCLGLMRRFRKDGFTIGYMKPISTKPALMEERVIDEDAHFVRSSFGLTDSLEDMVPVILTDQKVSAVLSGDDSDLTVSVRSAFDRIALNKDIMVLEGGQSLREGWIVNLAAPHVSSLLGARELIVIPYRNDLGLVDDLITARVRLGDSLLGGVINYVPKHRHDFVMNEVKAFSERHGVPIFAVLPRERLLLSASVAELNERLGGEVLTGHAALNGLVENLVVGAMNVDSALKYLRRKANQAVVTGGDRPDIQLAALETSTRCLVLTGNIRPSNQIISRAKDMGIPIILTRHDTMTTVERIGRYFGRARFHQKEKIKKFETLLNKHMDFDALYQALGVRGDKGGRD